MDEHSMLNMTVTLFRRTTNDDDDIIFKPSVLKNCFIRPSKGIYLRGTGEELKAHDENRAVIPISALSSLDEVSPIASASNIYGGADVIHLDDFIALGEYTNEVYTLSDIAKLPNCFCIKIASRLDFSSIPCYFLKGE